jgi:hypothetical protein
MCVMCRTPDHSRPIPDRGVNPERAGIALAATRPQNSRGDHDRAPQTLQTSTPTDIRPADAEWSFYLSHAGGALPVQTQTLA